MIVWMAGGMVGVVVVLSELSDVVSSIELNWMMYKIGSLFYIAWSC